MTVKQSQPPSMREANAMLALLRQLLAAHVESHRELLRRLQEKQDALRAADFPAIERIAHDEERLITRIGDLERKRSALLDRMAPALGIDAGAVRLERVADRVGAEASADLRERARELRGLIDSIRRESSIVRSAADALAQHLGGIVQTVQHAVSRAAVYGRRGRIDATTTPTRFSIDIRS